MQEPRDRHERQGVQREDVVVLVSDRRERAERLARGIALVLPCRVVEPGAALPATNIVSLAIWF